jgi:hypothetical protein
LYFCSRVIVEVLPGGRDLKGKLAVAFEED